MPRSFHNTVEAVGRELDQYEAKAGSQEAEVLRFFRERPATSFTPFEVWKMVFNQAPPITSVRRSITNLTRSGFLTKLPVQQAGPYGVPEHLWQWRRPTSKCEQMRLF